MKTIRRLMAIGIGSLAPLLFVTVATPALGHAADCGPGTLLDTNTNTCVPAQPPPAAPAWNGDLTPYFSVGTCIPIPIPFAPSICAGI